MAKNERVGALRRSLALPHDAVLHCYQRVLYYEPEAPVPLLPGKLDLGEHLQCAYGVLQLVEADPEAPMAMPYRGPVQVRARAGGERLTSPTAGTVSVKQLMQQACMPPWQRAYLPLLYVNDVLVCVPGLAVAKVDGAVPGDRYCRAVWRANS
ncbi:MAG: tRNA lysidine(34) synthetase TilS [Pseudomonadota bacterium]